MDGIIRNLLAASPQERIQLHRNDACLVPIAKVKELFSSIKNPSRRGKKVPSVNDCLNLQEVQSVSKRFAQDVWSQV